MIRRTALAATLATALAASVGMLAPLPASAQDRQVNVYNWNDYVDPAVLEAFTRETGIKVVYDLYDNNEIVEAKLLAGNSGYDIVVPSGSFLFRMGQAKLFHPVDRAKLKNAGNIWGEVDKRLQAYDPGNKFGINYMWGTVGIGLNLKKVKERLGEMPLNSWDIAFKPEIMSKLKDCGVHMLDAPEDTIPAVMNWLGLPGGSTKVADWTRAADHLMKIRTSVQKFHSSEYINALANGDICMVVGYSGDILQARKRAVEARNNVEIGYIIPKEGAQMWFDSMAIPADAKNKDEAYAFIDYMLRADVAAKNTNFVSYATGNGLSRASVKPEIASDPGVYPDEATFKRLFTNTPLDERTQRAVTRLWTRVKTGK
ncbi:MAG: polyamine ABC transporter substrate-binding protein [Bosea sp. (in: a-proteobacteria)]